MASKLITPKYITSTYFGTVVAIFDFSFSVCFLYVIFFLTPEWSPKAGPCYLFCNSFISALTRKDFLLLLWVLDESWYFLVIMDVSGFYS